MKKQRPPMAIRDHDKLYLQENRKHQPKESFKFIVSKARPHLEALQSPAIIDVGCATGDFLFYLNSQFPASRLTGLDIMPELLDRARQEVSESEFLEGNINQKASLPSQKFDAVFMNGVHSIFPALHPWLDNVIDLVDRSRKGKAFIYGIFNPEDLDVLIQTRGSNESPDSPWQIGWNCFSRTSVESRLRDLNVSSFTFHDFAIGVDIPRHKEDPLRSWTFLYADGTRGIINGTLLLHHFMLLEISP